MVHFFICFSHELRIHILYQETLKTLIKKKKRGKNVIYNCEVTIQLLPLPEKEMGIQVENKRKQIKENKTSYLKHQEVEFRKFSIKLNSGVVT